MGLTATHAAIAAPMQAIEKRYEDEENDGMGRRVIRWANSIDLREAKVPKVFVSHGQPDQRLSWVT